MKPLLNWQRGKQRPAPTSPAPCKGSLVGRRRRLETRGGAPGQLLSNPTGPIASRGAWPKMSLPSKDGMTHLANGNPKEASLSWLPFVCGVKKLGRKWVLSSGSCCQVSTFSTSTNTCWMETVQRERSWILGRICLRA